MTTPPDTLIELEKLDEEARSILFTRGRTANTFSSRPVTGEQLQEIYELAKWGPTWANTGPLRIVYVTTEDGKQRVQKHLQPTNALKAATAPVNAVLAVDNRYHDLIPQLLPFRPEMRDVFEQNEALRNRVRDLGGAMQAAYFIMSVRAAGLAAGPMGGFDQAGLDAELFPDGGWSSILVVNIGHPGENAWFDRLPRLSYADAVRHL